METPEVPSPEPSEMVPARIGSISITNLGFILFLKIETDDRVLPIFIGANEAQSIALAIKQEPPPRPMTHDLLKSMLECMDCAITRVEVNDLKDNTFFGKIYVRKAGFEDIEFDARPSDAMAMAIRWEAPIFVSRSVFESAAVPALKNDEEENIEPQSQDDTLELEPKIIDAPARSPIELLKNALAKAIKQEHYEEAARLRDELKKLSSGN